MPGMFAILSPAKTLDMSASTPARFKASTPRLAGDTKALAATLEGYTAKKLATLMSISPTLAKENAQRWEAFGSRSNPRAAAAMCFRGDVFQGLEAWTMNATALKWAQARIRILSGLYGVLRPLDTIQAYRLEMGTRLKTDRGASLYDFWKDRIARVLKADIKDASAKVLINLASDEYARAAKLNTLGIPVLDVKFLQIDKGSAKFMAFYGKRARGLMARWMAENRPTSISDLGAFDTEGYRFDKRKSSEQALVFTRPKPATMKAG